MHDSIVHSHEDSSFGNHMISFWILQNVHFVIVSLLMVWQKIHTKVRAHVHARTYVSLNVFKMRWSKN